KWPLSVDIASENGKDSSNVLIVRKNIELNITMSTSNIPKLTGVGIKNGQEKSKK
ncbi:3405_t:CDS:1, partial [Gigaspora rosea]